MGERKRFLTIFLENEKQRERGSNLRRQRQGSPTAQVLVAQTTWPMGEILPRPNRNTRRWKLLWLCGSVAF